MQDFPELKVGLLTDLHYDGSAQAMNRLYESVALLCRCGIETLVVMGDLVNGDHAFGATRLLREVAALCSSFNGPIHYMPGNHDLDYLSKRAFYEALGLPDQSPHFSFCAGGHEFLCLDGNYSPDGTEYCEGNFSWEQAAVPQAELNWLRERLAANGMPTVIFSHQRVDMASTHSVQNDAEVREVITGSGKVKAVVQGHRHADDFHTIEGTAYYTLSAHVDGAGPAMLLMDEHGLRLIRDAGAAVGD